MSQLPPPAPSPLPPAPVGPQRPQPSVVEMQDGPGLLVRAVWFVLVGWWLTGIVSTIAWLAMITIIGLPLGAWLINRIPMVISLRPRTHLVTTFVDDRGFVRQTVTGVAQQPWWLRAIWFLLVGWWASALVMAVGYALVLLIITLPIGLMIYNRVPFVASLYRY